MRKGKGTRLLVGVTAVALSAALTPASAAPRDAQWSKRIVLSSNGNRDARLALSEDGTRALAVWLQGRWPSFVVRAASARIDGTKVAWDDPRTLGSAQLAAGPPAVAMAADGSMASVVWARTDGPVRLSAVQVSFRGREDVWSRPVVIGRAPSNVRTPDIALSRDGRRALVVWAEDGRLASALRSGGTWARAAVPTGPSRAATPRIAMSDDGTRASLTWAAYPGDHPRILAVTGSIGGGSQNGANPQAGPVSIRWAGTSVLGEGYDPQLAASPDGRSAAVRWLSEDLTRTAVSEARTVLPNASDATGPGAPSPGAGGSSAGSDPMWSEPEVTDAPVRSQLFVTAGSVGDVSASARTGRRSTGLWLTGGKLVTASGLIGVKVPAAPRLVRGVRVGTVMSVAAVLGDNGGEPLRDVEASLDGGITWVPSGQVTGSFMLTGLTPDRPYLLTVRGRNTAGAGVASEPVLVAAAAEVPTALEPSPSPNPSPTTQDMSAPPRLKSVPGLLLAPGAATEPEVRMPLARPLSEADAGSDSAVAPTRTSVRARLVGPSQVWVNIDPNSVYPARSYSFRLQGWFGRTWRDVGSFRTFGADQQNVISLKSGNYRIVVPAQFGMSGSISNEVQVP